MRNLWISVFLVVGVAAQARAEEVPFGRKGQLIFAVDRLMPLVAYNREKTSQTQNNATDTQSVSQTSLSFLWGNSSGLTTFGGLSPFTVPRLGFDFMVIDGLSVGTNLVFFQTVGGTTSNTQQAGGQTTTTSRDTPSTTLFGIAPRVGYIVPVAPSLAVWPRAGFSYYTASSTTKRPAHNNNPSSKTTISFSETVFDLEAMVAWMPIPHVVVQGGPVLDLPLTGKTKESTTQGSTTDSTSGEFSVLHVGLNFCLVVYL